MDLNLRQIASDLVSVDEALLHVPPQRLEFMASPNTSAPQLAPVDCNASFIHYLRALYYLRDASVRTPHGAPLTVCLGFIHNQAVICKQTDVWVVSIWEAEAMFVCSPFVPPDIPTRSG
jgi:hypothetical protein